MGRIDGGFVAHDGGPGAFVHLVVGAFVHRVVGGGTGVGGVASKFKNNIA